VRRLRAVSGANQCLRERAGPLPHRHGYPAALHPWPPEYRIRLPSAPPHSYDSDDGEGPTGRPGDNAVVTR